MKKRESGWELESGSAEEKNDVKCDAPGCSVLAGRGWERGGASGACQEIFIHSRVVHESGSPSFH